MYYIYTLKDAGQTTTGASLDLGQTGRGAGLAVSDQGGLQKMEPAAGRLHLL